jgi:hypothetical protein
MAVIGSPGPEGRHPRAPCHRCRHFRGFSRIVPPDWAPAASALCVRVKPVPPAVLDGGACGSFEAGEHPEYT